jgi:hypothetical protein
MRDCVKEELEIKLDTTAEDFRQILIKIAESSEENSDYRTFRILSGIESGDFSKAERDSLVIYIYRAIGKLH